MSYPLSRSPHLSQPLLSLSFSWVKTFEVDWLDSGGREGKLGRAGWRRFRTSVSAHCSPTHPRARELPAMRMPAEWSPPRAAAAAAATATGCCCSCSCSCHRLYLHSALTGRQKVQLTRERSLQWEWSGYIKESKERAKTQIRMQATSNLLNLLLLSLLAGLDPSKVRAIF